MLKSMVYRSHFVSGETCDESIHPKSVECLGKKYGILVLFRDIEVTA